MAQEKLAFLSVYHKAGIVEFARELSELGFRIISSSGTARTLVEAGMEVKDVAEFSGMGPILDHRVVTLVPQIHGGLLALPRHLEELEKLGFPWIDLACVDLYPLEEEIARQGSTRESVTELTDIGGPTVLRSGAKGRRIVIADPTDRPQVIQWLKAGCPDEEYFISYLVGKAEGLVAHYCLTSGRYQSGRVIEGIVGMKVQECVYGENPQQKPAGLYRSFAQRDDPLTPHQFEIVAGIPSYNNWLDLGRCLQTITHIAAGFDLNFGEVPCIALGVKHGNCCGAAVATISRLALCKMVEGDPRAVFGGVVATNFPIGKEEAEIFRTWKVTEGKRILDTVIAPSFSEEAIHELSRKGDKCRMLANPALASLSQESLDRTPIIRKVRGGDFVVQPNYTFVLDLKDPQLRWYGLEKVAATAEYRDLILAWAVGSTSNSNTITLVRAGRLLGNGVGQQDRVGAAQLAIERARRSGHETAGAVAYSDSFFPFTDGPEVLARAGVEMVLASSGSVKDDKVIEFCEQRKVVLLLVPDKQGRGFFGH
ncbi:MAG: hypothetical protein HY460_00105 [Parcubacteria group bacterium]|nr:hypothetical protein [Parcubacteria group bacterium]